MHARATSRPEHRSILHLQAQKDSRPHGAEQSQGGERVLAEAKPAAEEASETRRLVSLELLMTKSSEASEAEAQEVKVRKVDAKLESLTMARQTARGEGGSGGEGQGGRHRWRRGGRTGEE
eukprot:126523-Hanusia_phi.AAC.4